ncbi:Sigma factor algU regulatory protein MucB, partial [Pseudomonas syringae pv. maculicola]
SSVRKDPATQSSVTRLMYGDGLAQFSVFVEAVKGASSSDIRTQLGPTVAVSRRLTTPQGDMMVTVVGEVPMGTAERIALSMRNDETPVKK